MLGKKDGLQFGRISSFRRTPEFWRNGVLGFVLFLFLAVSSFGVRPAFGEVTVDVGRENASVSFSRVDADSVMVAVTDNQGNAITGLGPNDFTVTSDGKTAIVVSAEPVQTTVEAGLNIVMVVDNSFSMKERKAIKPLLAALNHFVKSVRPVDRVHLIVFDDNDVVNIDGYDLHVDIYDSNDPAALAAFLTGRFTDDITSGTYLYDAMYAGLDIIEKMPLKGNRFMIVFSDGEELNSTVGKNELEAAARNVDFKAYAIDYMPKQERDMFLWQFAKNHGGQLYKARSADELLPIFEGLSTAVFQQYIVTYRFAGAPAGTVSIQPSDTLVIEEATAIDISPLLNYVFFETNSAEMPDRYAIFSNQGETADFDPKNLRGSMDKYRQILNIVGKRMRDNPNTRITLVGCNSTAERNALDLSRSRANEVANYLRYIWGIDKSRMEIQARRLPRHPSNTDVPEGRQENQRVEIHSDSPEILSTVLSTYAEKISSTETIRLMPQIQSEAGIRNWTIDLYGKGDNPVKSISGEGMPRDMYEIRLTPADLEGIAGSDRLVVGFRAENNEGEVFENATASSVKVDFIERQSPAAEKIGEKIFEKYALILFPFDSAEIEGRNRSVISVVGGRIVELPNPRVDIVGHTDTIGTEEYNQNLSERRAGNAYDILASTVSGRTGISHKGVGENQPLYDNALPEGRMMNRTVTVTLVYEAGNR